MGYRGSQNPMVFRSGAPAEAAAETLAVRLADGGHSAKVTITMRNGWVAAKFVSTPQTPAEREAG